ncbi:TIGR04013 family B12-binding domain/radical SAM domain-containing protein [Methanofollis fontis]|uniref:TIGR04013 family B12-binding domain/radical SAM domain-containing protein n=1 Tax=Methanofollis fontis TaxID=2052832 RepID=A0A483CR78_9EURY|nr:TIGR04013 family B12-binding domain/radical SAM domain-containing protein [Methanofollis fontis]TAJ43821.1 TIGR04013 family B12-binding domain/radical SAM domain-containing protein [Methanofollis fontis]
MQVNWRLITAAKNSYAALYAACETEGYILRPVEAPEGDVTCYSLNSISAPLYEEEIREAACTTIVGGPHAAACPARVAEYADYVVTGEGEYALPRLLRAIESGMTGAVPGVMHRRSPFCPVDHTVFLPAYPPFSRMKGYIEISRGCPFGCAYCQTPSIFGRRMRHRPVDQIARFAAHYRDARFVTPNALAYGSDGITPRLDRVERLFRALQNNEIYFGTFPSEVRPEFVTDESLDLITRYCSNKRLHFGAQSGSDRVLRSLRRGHTVADVRRAIDAVRDHGMMPVVDFIVGLPCEEDGDQLATLDLVHEVVRRGRAHVHLFIPLPGTPMAGMRPRPLLPEVQRDLGRLALAGRISGSWSDPGRRFYSNR